MPFACIDLIQGKPPEHRAAVADIVYRGIVDVLKAPDGDRFGEAPTVIVTTGMGWEPSVRSTTGLGGPKMVRFGQANGPKRAR